MILTALMLVHPGLALVFMSTAPHPPFWPNSGSIFPYVQDPLPFLCLPLSSRLSPCLHPPRIHLSIRPIEPRSPLHGLVLAILLDPRHHRRSPPRSHLVLSLLRCYLPCSPTTRCHQDRYWRESIRMGSRSSTDRRARGKGSSIDGQPVGRRSIGSVLCLLGGHLPLWLPTELQKELKNRSAGW